MIGESSSAVWLDDEDDSDEVDIGREVGFADDASVERSKVAATSAATSAATTPAV